MRDTQAARVQRAQSTLEAMADTISKGKRHITPIMAKAVQCAEYAAAPVHAPAHGAEYARALLYFMEQLATPTPVNGDEPSPFAQRVAEQLDQEGVIWRPADQVKAARKQIGRLRSDIMHDAPHATAVPLTTLVWAKDSGDYVGRSYERLEDVELPIKGTYDNPLRVRISGRRTILVPVDALRYVEGRMIRTR